MNIESVAEQLNSSLQDLTIYHLIAEQAERKPQAIAIAAPNRTPLTYSRLQAHTNEVIKTLNTMGLGRGDRIAIVLPNGPEMAVAFLAVSACAIGVPLNPVYLASEFDVELSNLNFKALIVQSGIESPVRAVAQAYNIPIIELMPMLEAEAGIFKLTGDLNAPMVSNSFAQPEDVAVVLQTSGTTSQSKIVALTQSELCTSAHNIKILLELQSGDRCLNAMPLFHIYGLSTLLSSLSAGASVVCTPNFDLGKFFEWMEELNPTWYTAVPSMQQAIQTGVENNRKTAAEASLDSITQILAELETFSQEDAQKFLANAMRFKQTLQQGCNISGKVISRRQNLCPAPLSFEQQELWFLTQLEPDSPLNNVANAVKIHGDLCVAVLQQVLDAIVHRHEILRTTFDYLDNCPVQVIAAPQPAELTLVDLRSLPATEREIEAESLLLKGTQQIFNLKQLPLLRVTLVQLDAAEFILLLTNHQIIADRWSIGVFWQELAVLYQAFASSQLSSLSELPVQYADFAHWQRQWLQGEMLQSQLTYWQEQLGGNLPVLELPTDRPRLPIQTFRGARHFLKLAKALTEALKQLSQSEGVTLYMTLLAAFKTLLYRYSGQEHILVGSPIANRKQIEIERLIGCFVNTLVMRTDLSGNPTFRGLLGRVREVALGAYTHQDLPFEELVEELQLEQDTSHSPLFQVMFALQNAPMPSLDTAGLTLSPLEVDSGIAKFDLILDLSEQSEGLSGFFEYNTDLFDAATIAQMAGHLQTLLDGIVAHPEQRLGELPILSAAQRHQLLVEWNDTEVDYSQNVCIHQLFEAQVERTPDAIAVAYETKQLTYRELNGRANCLAHYLQSLGVKPGVLVGLCLERSLEMIVALVAILKAGGAYVPIDPKYPQERIAFVLEDTNAPVLLTQASLVASLPTDSARVVSLDTDWEIIAQEDKENSQSEVTPETLAYVIYTSGSTGKPKGVQILHRAVVNFLTSMSLTPGLTAQDILLSVTTISFDIAVLEIFLPLTVGASLVIASPEVVSDVYALQELLFNSGATVMQATPATW